jgi:hypothetical protein
MPGYPWTFLLNDDKDDSNLHFAQNKLKNALAKKGRYF